jgi:hypothetical protein
MPGRSKIVSTDRYLYGDELPEGFFKIHRTRGHEHRQGSGHEQVHGHGQRHRDVQYMDTDTDRINGVMTISPMSHKKSTNYRINISGIKQMTAKNNMTHKIMFLVELSHR